MSKVELQAHGNYLYGQVEGVDFTVSGKLESGQAYGASVKLKFTQKIETTKNVNGMDIPTHKMISQIIKIPTTDSELPKLVGKYNALINKDVLISYGVKDNHSFETDDDKVIALGQAVK